MAGNGWERRKANYAACVNKIPPQWLLDSGTERTFTPRIVGKLRLWHRLKSRYRRLRECGMLTRAEIARQLEARPFYVRLETRTRGHLLVVMLAYLMVQELAKCWGGLELTVEEGLGELKSLGTTQATVKGRSVLHNVPRPRESVQRLLDAAKITLPKSIADRGVRVSTRKKLVEERKTP